MSDSIPRDPAALLLQRLCGRLLQAHQDIRGIILFGSLAREEPHQDVDLMVVMGQKMERSERDKALLALRETLGPDAARVDLVVVHEEGLGWGLDFQSALYERSVTHCQQAVEKSVKAVLACMGRMEPSHYLSALLRSLLTSIRDVVWRERLERMAQIAAEMEQAAVDSRYPVEVEEKVIRPVERYGKAEAARALDLTRESLEIGRAFTHWWTEGNEGA